MKKQIDINFIGFWGSFDKQDNMLFNILKERYDVRISEKPDYLFVSPLGRMYNYMQYDCIRILYAGEEITPDFNCFDYAIGFDFLEFGDRYLRYPFCFYSANGPWHADALTRDEAYELLKKKDIFCNLIYWEDSIGGKRTQLFNAISAYKPVRSDGRLLNTVGGNGISYREKWEILRRSKFTIACEGCSYPGVVTEKMTMPLAAHSVPVFYGNERICEEFNADAFVNCHAYPDPDALAQRIRELDGDDEQYLQMLTSAPLVNDGYAADLYERLKAFLFHIFDQDPDEAKRRVDSVISNNYAKNYKRFMRISNILHF
ncbi:MAG: hypothetical protein IJJ85_00805 [Clostridia bacterium]|nr:hypothetical protein [Clostridia bacterium]